ncbi:helix-turn-helix domain-containing protein [Hymenobacter negativus]|uniref:Helix-turn-helix domain-containing protein n=1 Tax=Hymenobacter negativus TaxID=2795026 RepID=A0ABS3QAD3_9BACT|nr:helix-turn-helix domain-containing protein [Hymenobacter negativus]
MVERIRTLLETRQLTPTQFADAIGIARPIVSHILSGRNKPSLEVVQRILAAMPELSMPWLLNGTGPMQVSLASEATAASVVTPKEAPLVVPGRPSAPPAAAAEPEAPVKQQRSAMPYRPPAAQVAPKTRTMPKRFTPLASKEVRSAETPAVAPAVALTADLPASIPPAVPAPTPEETPKVREVEDVSAMTPVTDNSPAIKAADSTATSLFAGTEKPIRRIVIFYRDGSFADYQPE